MAEVEFPLGTSVLIVDRNIVAMHPIMLLFHYNYPQDVYDFRNGKAKSIYGVLLNEAQVSTRTQKIWNKVFRFCFSVF